MIVLAFMDINGGK